MTEVKIQKTENGQAFSLQYPYDWNQDGQQDEVKITFRDAQFTTEFLAGNVDVFLTVDGNAQTQSYKFAMLTDIEGMDPIDITKMRYSRRRDTLFLKCKLPNTRRSVRIPISMSEYFRNKIVTSNGDVLAQRAVQPTIQLNSPVLMPIEEVLPVPSTSE